MRLYFILYTLYLLLGAGGFYLLLYNCISVTALYLLLGAGGFSLAQKMVGKACGKEGVLPGE